MAEPGFPRWAAAVLGLMVLVAPLVAPNDYWIGVMARICLYATLALGLNIVVGFAGLLDLAGDPRGRVGRAGDGHQHHRGEAPGVRHRGLLRGDRRQLSRLLAALGVPRELPLHRVDQYPGDGDPGRDGQPARGRGRSRAAGVDPRGVPRPAALSAARLRAHADGADGVPAPGVAELRAPQPGGARAGGRRRGVTGARASRRSRLAKA